MPSHPTLLLVAALCALPANSTAQGREPLAQPTSVPVNLAAALASSGGFGSDGDPQILVGAIPEWAAARMKVPTGASVLGSAFLGSTVVAVITMPTSSDSLVRRIVDELLREGWREPPEWPFSSGGGFRPSRGNFTPLARRVTLCGANQVLSVWTSRRQAAQSTVIMRLSTPQPGFNQCNPPQVSYTDADRGSTPTLYDPENATESRNMGMIGFDCEGRDEFGAGTGGSTRLRTPMSPEAILDHYGKQLADSGWTAASLTTSSMGRRWTRSDSAGRALTVVLTVKTRSGDATCRSVDMMVYRPRP